MAKIELKGLNGLKGLSGSEYTAWRNAQVAAGKITSTTSYAQEEVLYNNQQYVAKYGMDAFKSKSYDDRMQQWEYDIIQPAFYKAFNPFFDDDENSTGPNGELYDASKGMGRDFFKYNLMSLDAKRQLLESDWLTPSEMDKKVKNNQDEHYELMKDPKYMGTEAGSAAISSWLFLGKDLDESITRGQNDKLIQKIYSEDLKQKTTDLAPVVDQFYAENIAQMSDDEVKSKFMKAIKPGEGEGAAYIYSTYFNDNGTSSESETEKFSIDDMRQFLARKAVYDYYLGPEAGYDALNNQGKEYINDHQAWYTYTGLLAKDIGISTASYTADKWNSIRRLTLLGRDADVYITNNGEVVPTADVKIDGDQAYYEKDGKKIIVHKETLSLTTLDDLGKDSNGEDRGWFNNAQFWTNAEQFGTMDEEEQAQYKKLGYSPYKVVYKPGDESDIWYEAIKMTSFGLADMASNFIPAGGAAAGTNMIAKAASMTGNMAKAMSYAGKGLYYTSKSLQKATPVVSATAIGNAYGRGVFGEAFTGNLQRLEQSVADQAQIEVYNLYNNDSQYKKQVDAEVEQRYQELLAAQNEQMRLSESQNKIFDQSANEKSLRSRAMQEVLSRKTTEWADNFKNSDMYGDALQEAAESASDAALTSSLTTAAKYTAVNYGWRKFLFKTPSELANSYKRGAVAGVTESVNSAGKKRLISKFDFATIGGQTRELAKTVGSQMWGGAWTNATDELQSGGGRKINEDRMSQFISGMYNGKAMDARYSIMDGLSSYFHGAVQTLAKENTYRAGLVGGLGSITSFSPNLVSLVSTKNFRQTWRESSFGEKLNMLLSNGVLNNYYAKKQGQLQLRATVDLVNNMLDQTNDFEAIDQAIALDMASIDATNPEDANALTYLKAVQAIDMLNNFKEDKEAARVGRESTVMEKAMTTIEKLSDPSTLSDAEREDFLSQYYAENPGVAQSEEQNEMALNELQQRAQRLQEATETYADIENTLGKVEKSRGVKLPNQVRARLVQRLTLDKFLTDRTAELEEKITGNSTPSSSESIIESYGTESHQKTKVRATENLVKSVDKEIADAERMLSNAEWNMKEYNSTPQNDQGFVKKTQLQNAIDNARIQVEHLNSIKRGLNLELDRFSEQVPIAWMEGEPVQYSTEAKTSDRVISSDEILRLNPQDRARMLDKTNYDNYSDAQKVEIDKLKNELTVKDPTILDDIQNQANLTQRIDANRRAYSMMLENPEAAAYQLESDMSKQALEAKAVHMDRIATKLSDVLHKFYDEATSKGEDENNIRTSIYKNLRVLNRDILSYMDDADVMYSMGTGFMAKEVSDALDWSDMTDDMSSIIDSMEMDDTSRKAFETSLDNVLNNTRTREEVVDELGKVVESTDVSADTKAPFEELLSELEQLWDQRASTTSMTREERKAAQEESKRKLAEEEARKKEAEDKVRLEANGRPEGQLREAREESKREQDINNKAEEERLASEKQTIEESLGVTSKEEDDRLTSERRAAELANMGLTEKDLITNNEATVAPEKAVEAAQDGESVQLESPSLEEQVANTEASTDKVVDIIPAPKDDSTDQGNSLPDTSDTLLGNSMYGYELNPLKYHGKQIVRKGANPNDKMSRYFEWLDTAGIKLQDIIDTELSDIMKLNPDVYPMFVKYDKNATHDDAMGDFALLTVEYTQDVANIHNDNNGGVITSNGKSYLVIGTLGFARGNRAQGDMVRSILNSSRKPWFDTHPSERFYVDTSRHTKVQSITSGRLVRQLVTDSEVQIRSISELLADDARNPKGLTMEDLKWGIQYNAKMATVNVSDRNTVYPPSDGASNLGSVFLLVETANGNYIPAYIRPIRLSELKDGKLKTQLNDLINELTSTEHSRRLAAIKQLVQSLNLSQEEDNILIGTKDKPTVSILKGGSIIRTFNLADANFDRTRFLNSIMELDPRVNITTSALSTEESLRNLDEAGALTTDLAKIGTSGASYNVYAMDADGNPIITTPVENEAPTLDAGSDLSKAQKKLNSERVGNTTYRRDDSGKWYTETDKLVTDPRLIEQLNYRNLIRTRGLKPDKVVGTDEVFVINNDKDNPLVLIRRNNKQVVAMTKEGAIKTINDLNAAAVERARQERLKKELEIEASNDEALNSMSEEEKRKAALEGEDVDLSLGETLTEDQIIEQMVGNFESEATPQQKTAEELVDKITSDTADIQLSEDGSTYVDSSGKHYARVTSVIAADDTSDGKFEADNPWGLPSATIGTGIDEFVRDFFDNKIGNVENLSDRYPNASNEQLQAFAKQLEELKTKFKRRGLTIVPRDVTVTGTVEVKTKSGDRRVIDVAGTLDLLAYDREGNFYIFDMKTNRSAPTGEAGKKKGAKWSRQLTLYKQFLQEKYGAVVRGLEIIPIQVSYPAPKGWGNATTEYTEKNGQLYANGTEYKSAKPILHDNIPIAESILSIDYSKLTPAEQAMVRTLEDVAPTRDKETPIVQPEPVKTGEDINKTGTKSLAELQSGKTTDTALSIIKSKEFGSRTRALLKAKFPDMPSKVAELERFLQGKGITTTGITNVEDWLKMIEECK